MSGVTDFVSKAFKRVKKIATKLWDNKLIRAVIIAVAVYYTAGMAAEAGWFAPAAGEGGSLAAAGANGTTFTTVAESGATVSSIGAETTAAADIAGTAMAAPSAAMPAAEVAGTAVAEGAATGLEAADAAMYAESLGSIPQPAGIIDSAMTGVKAAGSWMKANPMATMMLGQGVSGAMSSYEMRKAEDRARAQENREFERRGLMGFDVKGRYAGAPGIVASQVAAPSTVAAPAAQRVRPIERKNLAELHNQGLVRSQQRA